MHGIPVEVLRQIFREAVFQARPVESARVPVYISHVCRLWREISLSYGILWASLSINYDGSEGREKRKVLIEVFDAFLRRTGGSALDFSVHLELRSMEIREVHYAAEYIVKRLISQQRRWRDVAFVWRFPVWASSDFRDIEFSKSEMPMLLSLKLEAVIHDHLIGRKIRPYINISQSSRLQEIRLAGNYVLDCGDHPISVPTKDIILDLSSRWEGWRAEKVCLDLLKIAPRCTSLHAKFHTYTTSVESELAQRDETDQIVHDAKRLRLEYSDFVPLVLSKLTLPSLEDLFFETDQYRDAYEVLLKCIQRSLPPLLDLGLGGIGRDEESLIDILRLLPTLRSLALYDTAMSAQLFEELTCYGDTNVSSTFDRRITCPSLKKLVIDIPLVHEDLVPACADAFCTMVESRWNHLKSFKTVVLDEQRTDVCSIRKFQEYLEYCFHPRVSDEYKVSILVEGAS